MAKAHGMAAIALFGWTLWAAQSVAAPEPTHGVCGDGVSNGCPAGTVKNAPFAARPPPLFSPASTATPVALVAPSTHPPVPGHSPRQAVRIDFAHLRQAREALAEGRETQLTVNLPDLPLPVVWTATSDTARGYALSGRVANDPLSSVNVVVNGRTVAGNVRRAGELHTIRTAGAGHYVQTLDGLTGTLCEVGRFGEPARETAQAPPLQSPAVANVAQDEGGEDDGSVIDVLVVYTPDGRRSAGGHESIRTLIEMLVQETNQAYGDSDVRQRIRLVAATEVDYEMGGIREALQHLREEGDGHLDEVHQIRGLYAADLVLLWTPSGGGLASIIDNPWNATAASLGFSVSTSQAFTHELGHNMGLRHERSNDGYNTPYPYSHGYLLSHGGAHYRTIMHRDGGLPRFSNPQHLYPDSSGRPLGVPGDTPTSRPDGPADAARSLNNTAAAVANFKFSGKGCQYDLPSPSDMTAEGGSFTISVATAANCRWEVKALDPGLSITEGFTGEGNGQVVVIVGRNPGWDRELALRVAGEIHSFRQEGTKPFVSVCDRSSGVRDGISRALDGQPCAETTAGDLARIGSLRVNDSGVYSLGDFDGLTGLGSLVLWGGDSTTHLGSAVFAGAGLDNLRSLRISVVQGGTLHLAQGVFEGLSALDSLTLAGVSWQPGLFEDTPSVHRLELDRYPSVSFPDGAFRGLDNLKHLISGRSRVEILGSGVFRGLVGLRSLFFRFGHLRHLSAGAFEGLSELTHVSLRRNRLSSLHGSQFRGAPKLRWIDLAENSLGAVGEGVFSGVPLEYLDLSDSELTSLSADAFDQAIKDTLKLSGNRLMTLDPRLFEGGRFWILDLSDNDISDIRSLSGVYAEEIDLSGNAIVDLSPLNGNFGLHRLDLSDNQIFDLSPLSELSRQLTYLDLSHNKIVDISPLVRDGLLGEVSSLFLHANPLAGTVFGGHVATLRSRGVSVSHIHVWPVDSSAKEGEDFEFVVRLSSALDDPIAFDWRVLVADHHDEDIVGADLSNFVMTAKEPDFSARCRGWNGLICELYLVGEIVIGATHSEATVIVPGASEDRAAEKHETFGIALLPNSSGYPDGIALPGPDAHWGTGRLSAAVGLIVDPAGPSHHVPLFLVRGNASGRQSILRLVSPMDGSPAHVEVFDALGRKHGATTLSTREALSRQRPDPSRSAVAQFNSEDLEDGDHDTGLSKGVGQGGADWRLRVWANDAQALTYIRHADGFLTSMHDGAPQGADGTYTYGVPTFNPASNTRQRSVLRLVNPGTEASGVRIVGTDDAGAPGGAVSLSVEAGGARELSAADLESGLGDLRGALGDGQGKWRLNVASDQPLLVTSLLESPTGRLTNLSTVPDNKERGPEGATTHHVPLFLSAADQWGRRSFVRVVNRGEATATVRIRPFDDTVRDYGSVPLMIAAGEATHFNSHHLEVGGAGLSGGVGAGEGDWRLELETMADIDVLSYVRHADGFLTSMHDMVRASPEGHVVPILNPAGDDHKGLLRLVNPRAEDAAVTIRGIDDGGVTRGSVRLVVPAGRSRTVSAEQMEAGHDALDGALGDGQGKWRLVVRSDVQIQVMGLLEGPAGHLTNLSTAPHMRNVDEESEAE